MPTLCFVERIKNVLYHSMQRQIYNTSRAGYNAPGANALTGNETKLSEVRCTACAKCPVRIIGASLSEPHTSVTALQVTCTFMSGMYICKAMALLNATADHDRQGQPAHRR